MKVFLFTSLSRRVTSKGEGAGPRFFKSNIFFLDKSILRELASFLSLKNYNKLKIKDHNFNPPPNLKNDATYLLYVDLN